jgi:hypothetical protein
MKVDALLRDEKFNHFFSLLLGIGLVCIIRPMCSGKECVKEKPPAEKDFDQYVYSFQNKCYEFSTKVISCPASGAIEAFRGQQVRRASPIPRM